MVRAVGKRGGQQVSEKCNYCKKCKVDLSYRYNFANYCEECYKEITNKKQKHEETKRMAWEYCNVNFENIKKMHKDNEDTHELLYYCLEISWQAAEAFYNFAKEKEGADEEDRCAWIKCGGEMRINAKEKEERTNEEAGAK